MKPCSHCGRKLADDHDGACPACGVAPRPDEWAPDRTRKWLAGFVAPLPLVALAINCFATRQAVLPSWIVSLRVEGREAVAVAAALISAAMFLHARYFWGESWALLRVSEPAQMLAALSFIASMGYLAVSITHWL